MRLLTTSRFKKAAKRRKDLTKLWGIVERPLAEQPLEPRHRPHRLSGTRSRHWECHIEPDWLLIWGHDNDCGLIMVRTGSHADLFA